MDVKWGIIGTGQIARKFAGDYQAVDTGEIRAVGSRSLDKARSFADSYQIPKAYGSYEELVKDDEVNAIYVATPHSYHYTHSLLALKHDKAVLCEKPVAMNSAQLKAISDVAKARNLLFMEAMWTYFLPPVRQAMEWVNAGEIGKVQVMKANFGFAMDFDPESRVYNPDLAGGPLLDVGIYPVALAGLLMQKHPSSIQAVAKKGPSDVDHTTLMHLRYEDDVLAQLDCSVENHTTHDAWIYGSEGFIHIPDFWRARRAFMKNRRKKLTFEDPRESLGYNYEIEAMNTMLLEGITESAVMPFEASFRNIGVLDKVRDIIGLKYPDE